MAFVIGDVLAKILTGWGLNLAAVLAEAERIKAQFPDLAARIEALEAWLRTQVSPNLDPATIANTIRGIAADIVSGMSGVDSDAWRGSV
jgi:hypothetical protein